MPFTALANLLFSSYDKSGDVEEALPAPPPEQVVKIFTAWIEAKFPVPKDWEWQKVGMTYPIQFLTRHFHPSYVPLIVKCSQNGFGVGIPRAYMVVTFFEIEKLTAHDQALILPYVFANLSFSERGDFYFKVINACRKLQSHLFAWFMKQETFDINYRNQQGQTLLHEALSQKNYVTVRVLLSFKADVNVPDNDGITPKAIIDNQIKPQLKLLESLKTTSDEKEISSVTEAEFKAEVENFLEQHVTDIPTLFSENSIENPNAHLLAQGFLINPVIHTYLARPDLPMITGNVPVYSDEEKSIYVGMGNKQRYQDVHMFPYRTDALKYSDDIDIQQNNESKKEKYCYEFFYEVGMHLLTRSLPVKRLREQLAPGQPIYFLNVRDVYVFGEVIQKIAKRSDLRINDDGFTFVVSAVPKDKHIVTLLSIINARKNEVLYHVLLDSGIPSEDYLKYLSDKIDHGKKDIFTKKSQPSFLVGASLGIQTRACPQSSVGL